MKRFLILFLTLLLGETGLNADTVISVGTEIREEDISDFYYTVSASVYPPVYQRYRFYAEGGKKWFYHESRQGGGWPQTEEDIVLSGTVELTEGSWHAFFDCLRDGTVSEREEELRDGDDGPWTYLYWQKDEGRNQVFSFASPGKRNEFEELCSELAQNHIVTWLSFSRGGYMMPQTYEIFLRGGSYYLRENEEEATLLEDAYADEILQMIIEDHVESWDGFHESEPDVLDGEFFSFELRFADGTSVYASGSNSFPENYHDAAGRITDTLTRHRMFRMAGIYRYTGEDHPLEIRLEADGTYICSDGAADGPAGRGMWNIYDNAVYLSETGDSGLDFMFEPEKDALIYLAWGSDEFPSVSIPDGARFERPAAE